MLAELEKPITYLKGVGPKRAELYQKLGIGSVYELLNHFPDIIQTILRHRRYEAVLSTRYVLSGAG